MSSLEYAFRPSTSPDSHGRIIIPSTPTATRQRATLTWGAKATMPPKVSAGPQIACCNEVNTEKTGTRQSEIVRIFQNDDPTSPNWVDVSRAQQVSLQKKETNNCFANSPDNAFSTTNAELAGLASEFNLAFGVTATTYCGVTWIVDNSAP